jgi:hypothetical protein
MWRTGEAHPYPQHSACCKRCRPPEQHKPGCQASDRRRARVEGEGRCGPRGGSTAHSPASTPHPLLKKNPLQPSRLPPDKPSLQSLPRHRQQFCSLCHSWPHRHSHSAIRHSRPRHCWRHRCSWHRHCINAHKQSVRRPGLVVRLQFSQRRGRSHSSTAASRRPQHFHSRRPVRRSRCPPRRLPRRHLRWSCHLLPSSRRMSGHLHCLRHRQQALFQMIRSKFCVKNVD